MATPERPMLFIALGRIGSIDAREGEYVLDTGDGKVSVLHQHPRGDLDDADRASLVFVRRRVLGEQFPALFQTPQPIPSIEARAGEYILDDGSDTLLVMHEAPASAITADEFCELMGRCYRLPDEGRGAA